MIDEERRKRIEDFDRRHRRQAVATAVAGVGLVVVLLAASFGLLWAAVRVVRAAWGSP